MLIRNKISKDFQNQKELANFKNWRVREFKSFQLFHCKYVGHVYHGNVCIDRAFFIDDWSQAKHKNGSTLFCLRNDHEDDDRPQ